MASPVPPAEVVTGTPVPPPGGHVRVTVGDQAVAVFNVGGRLYGLQAECSHHGGSLSEGTVEDGAVTCPKHGAVFRLDTGEVLKANFLIRRATGPVRTFRVRSVEGHVALASSPASA